MSSSVFKESYDDASTLKPDPNLVILVDKSGKVSVDKRTLQDLLTNKSKTDTAVTIVRVGSPTPSMQAEMDEEDKQRLSDLELLETLNEDLDKPTVVKRATPPPRVGITVENYYPPHEAKTFVAEVLSLAGIDNPLTIDCEFQRYAIQNDHCYTNLLSPQKPKTVVNKKLKSSPVTVRRGTDGQSSTDVDGADSSRNARQRKPSAKVLESTIEEDEDSQADPLVTSVSDLQNILEDSGSEFNSEEDATPSEGDNDSDLDYNLSQGNTIPKNTKKKRRKKRKNAAKPVRETKKRKSHDGDVEALLAELDGKRSVKKAATPRKVATGVRRIPSRGKQIPESKEPEPEKQPEPKVVVVKQTPPPPPPMKKEKKSAAHMDALFSDMSSLFSKPDKIIRKPEPPKPVATTSNNKGFVTLTPKTKLPGTISVQTHTSASEFSTEQDKQLDLIDSIVTKELEGDQVEDLPDNALLETLGEALPEDFLQHVAELAENKELQEIIDKQVLGVDTDTSLSASQPVIVTTPNVSVTKSAAAVTPSSTTKTPGRQVMRPGGRVITLPPIEVPTTRAKRRAQNDSVSESAEVTPAKQTIKAQVVTPTVKDTEVTKDRSREQSREKSTSRRSSVNRSSMERRDSNASSKKSEDKKRKITNPAVLAVLQDDDDLESDQESWNSEDDPDRLWCICRQPHNNRFMICCDSCEEWFHGKCVNVTKAMGKEMEATGRDWTCPNCVKMKKEREQPRITTFLNESGGGESNKQPQLKSPTLKSPPTKLPGIKSPTTSTPKLVKKIDTALCVVCKNPTRPNSVYCSDDCIIKHAQNALVSTKTVASSSKTASSASDDGDFDTKIQTSQILKAKDNRVTVIEKSTGKILSGNNAPTAQNLKQWLKEHPTFQVRLSPAAANQAFLAKKQQLKEVAKKMKVQGQGEDSKLFSQPTKIQTKLKFEVQPKRTSSPRDDSPAGSSKQVSRKSIDIKSPVYQKSESSTPKSSTPKPVERPKIKKQTSLDQKFLTTPPDSSKSTDQFRSVVKNHLKDLLIARTKEITDSKTPRLTDQEIESFANEVESEMYELFNRDTGHKYKAKYRSLLFNIKDPKNLTLFQKISEKAVSADRLVRMEPQELASQELAKWRENESKHQLEMIKKSELELLACSKNYVLKTHKGEEVVEDRSTDRIELDQSVAVEHVVSLLNNSNNVTSTTEDKKSKAPEAEDKYVKSYTHDDSGHSSKKKDSKRRSRSRSRERRGKHKKRRSRSRSRERRGRSHDRHHHDKKKHEHRSSERKHDKRDKPRSDKRDEKPSTAAASSHTTTSSSVTAGIKVEDYNLVDKILEASQAIVSSGRLDVEKIAREQAAAEKQQAAESEAEEPTSTVTIPTPPHISSPAEALTSFYSGGIKMIDVASFKIEAQSVSGDAENVAQHFPKVLEVVGRIAPEAVYDYIGKIKNTPNKEILIIRFSSPDVVAYTTLYKYHDQRRRLGVIKTAKESILKDFYLLPLPAEKKLPSVLLPINGVGFVEGDQKPDLLLGVIVRLHGSNKKLTAAHKTRPTKPEIPLQPPIISKKSWESIDPLYSVSDERGTPPGSPRKRKSNKSLLHGLPRTRSTDNPEDDEPYSPGGSDDEILTTVTKTKTVTTTTVVIEDEVSKKVDEINRQIEARKLEIASMIGADPDELDEPYSPSRVTPPIGSSSSSDKPSTSLFELDKLDNIALPTNLSEILASIKGVSATTAATAIANATGMDVDEEYDPTATTTSSTQYTASASLSYKAGYVASSGHAIVTESASLEYNPTTTTTTTTATSGQSKLSQMTDEELLAIAEQQQAPEPDKQNDVIDIDEDDIFEIPDEDEGIRTRDT